MIVHRIIKNMRVRLSDPSRWTKHVDAENKEGCWANAGDEDAARWCLRGAALAETGCTTDLFRRVMREIEARIPEGISVVAFNDSDDTTHADVLNLLDTTLKEINP